MDDQAESAVLELVDEIVRAVKWVGVGFADVGGLGLHLSAAVRFLHHSIDVRPPEAGTSKVRVIGPWTGHQSGAVAIR